MPLIEPNPDKTNSGENYNPANSQSSLNGKGRFWVLGLIILLFISGMAIVTEHDRTWTIWLSEHSWPGVIKFLRQTCFEGEGFGGTDSASFFIAASFFLYIFIWLKGEKTRLFKWRPYFGFIVTSSFFCGLFMVHSLKWFMGRARPGPVLNNAMDYSSWFELGPHYVTEGIYRGSLPSGHTAEVMSFMTLAYILAANRKHSFPVRLLGFLFGVVALAYGIIMALGCSMSLSHWITDCIFSICIGWILIHVIYFWVLKIPEQMEYYNKHGMHTQTPKLWELLFCVWAFFVATGGMSIGLGFRSFWKQPVPWLALLIPFGLFLVFFFGRKCIRLYSEVFKKIQRI